MTTSFSLRILAAACLIALTACGPTDKEHNHAQEATRSVQNEFAKDLPASAEVIQVATDAAFPPYEFRDEYGNIIGLEIDLINAIASDQGMKVIVRHEPWRNIFSKVSTPDSNSKQLVMAVISDNAERRATYQLSNSYLSSPNIILTKEESTIKTPKDLNGKTVSILENSASADMLKQARITPKAFHTNSSTYQSFKELVTGKSDAIFDDGVVLAYHMKNHPEYKLRKVLLTDKGANNDGSVAFVSNKGNTALINKINAGIANIKQNGTYDKIMDKWISSK